MRLVKKIRPNSRILSITTQSRFFISLHVHNFYKAISSLLVLFFLGNLQKTVVSKLLIISQLNWNSFIVIKFWEQSRLEPFDYTYLIYYFLIINFLGAAFTLCILFLLLFSVVSFRNWLRGILFISIFYLYKQSISWLTTQVHYGDVCSTKKYLVLFNTLMSLH